MVWNNLLLQKNKNFIKKMCSCWNFFFNKKVKVLRFLTRIFFSFFISRYIYNIGHLHISSRRCWYCWHKGNCRENSCSACVFDTNARSICILSFSINRICDLKGHVEGCRSDGFRWQRRGFRIKRANVIYVYIYINK